jgi:hypothetical protein
MSGEVPVRAEAFDEGAHEAAPRGEGEGQVHLLGADTRDERLEPSRNC